MTRTKDEWEGQLVGNGGYRSFPHPHVYLTVALARDPERWVHIEIPLERLPHLHEGLYSAENTLRDERERKSHRDQT